MTHPGSVEVLNRLLRIQYRSLPMFLAGTSPWTHQGDERAEISLTNIVADQKAMVQRIAETILEHGGQVDTGNFLIEFAELHFLSLDYLLKELVERQRADLADIERCVAHLTDDRIAKMLAEEVLGAERAHLEALEELAARANDGASSGHPASTV